MPKLPGIYKLTNTVNGKVYIGKSVDMHQRFIDYNGDIRKGKKRFILDAIRKYGWDSFRLEIVEIYPTRKIPNDYLLEREAFWIRFYSCAKRGIGYNLCEYGRDRGGIPLTEEHKRKIRESNIGKKRTYSDEWRKNVAIAHAKRRGEKFTQEHRKNMSLGRRDRLITYKIDPITQETVETFPSSSLAEQAIGVKRGSLCYAVKTNKILCGFLWKVAKVTNC